MADPANSSQEACAAEHGRAAGPGGCPAHWDTLLCWPPTAAGAAAELACRLELHGIVYDPSLNATRLCLPNGTWARSDYEACQPAAVGAGAPGADPAATAALLALYLAGYCLSLAALLAAVAIFVCFKDLRCLRNLIHTNLMLSYICADAVWILNLCVQAAASSGLGWCVFLVLLLQYFLLTNFFWMFVEGLYLFMLVVATFTGDHIKLRVYALVGWGTPLLIVALWGALKCAGRGPADGAGPLQADPADPGEALAAHCPWMVKDELDWIHKAPAIAVLAANFVFLVLIMWVLITKLRSANSAETQQYRKASKALLVLIPLLGVAYILMLRGPSALFFECVRTALLSLQGFAVALFYCFLNTEVQNAVRHRLDRWRAERSLGGGRRGPGCGCGALSRDWSPRSRTESIRLGDLNALGGCGPGGAGPGSRKRESTASEATTTTLLGGNNGWAGAGRPAGAPQPLLQLDEPV